MAYAVVKLDVSVVLFWLRASQCFSIEQSKHFKAILIVQLFFQITAKVEN